MTVFLSPATGEDQVRILLPIWSRLMSSLDRSRWRAVHLLSCSTETKGPYNNINIISF